MLHTYSETVSPLQSQGIFVLSFASYLGGVTGDVDVSAGFFNDYGSQPSIPQSTSGEVYEIDELLTGGISFADTVTGFLTDRIAQAAPGYN